MSCSNNKFHKKCFVDRDFLLFFFFMNFEWERVNFDSYKIPRIVCFPVYQNIIYHMW